MPKRTRERASDVIRIIQLDASSKSDTAGTKRAGRVMCSGWVWSQPVCVRVCVCVCVAQQMKCASVVAERESNVP